MHSVSSLTVSEDRHIIVRTLVSARCHIRIGRASFVPPTVPPTVSRDVFPPAPRPAPHASHPIALRDVLGASVGTAVAISVSCVFFTLVVIILIVISTTTFRRAECSSLS